MQAQALDRGAWHTHIDFLARAVMGSATHSNALALFETIPDRNKRDVAARIAELVPNHPEFSDLGNVLRAKALAHHVNVLTAVAAIRVAPTATHAGLIFRELPPSIQDDVRRLVHAGIGLTGGDNGGA